MSAAPSAAPAPIRTLLLGAGQRREKILKAIDPSPAEFEDLTTVDVVAHHGPDHVHDLNVLPWPFEDDAFDEVHAYEVLEHLGALGDEVSLFDHFSEVWRILRPGGRLAATVPHWAGLWAFGDPQHKRVINPGTLVFLDQDEYRKQIGRTPMSDYRHLYRADLKLVWQHVDPPDPQRGKAGNFSFIVEARKPSRWLDPAELPPPGVVEWA